MKIKKLLPQPVTILSVTQLENVVICFQHDYKTEHPPNI